MAIDTWLLYATGGVAVTNLKGDFTFTDNNSAVTETASASATKAGWTAGGGVEKAWSRWSLRVEYLYVSFGSIPATAFGVSATSPFVTTQLQNNPFTHGVDLRAHIARIGLNYRFGGDTVYARY